MIYFIVSFSSFDRCALLLKIYLKNYHVVYAILLFCQQHLRELQYDINPNKAGLLESSFFREGVGGVNLTPPRLSGRTTPTSI